ncbi:bifunctional phosphopantothenoylcysteine decarboxylase/phosphopantothenate--cysteine ligase CoaBC, partial [Candidatus Desantisbacteria bacterium CG_4_9_14_3_um_filter_50_7]
SSGKMGFALAEEARDRGAEVVLISGPVGIKAPQGIEYKAVTSARQME